MQDNENKVVDLKEVREGESISYPPVDSDQVYDAALKSSGRWKWWVISAIFGVLLIVVVLVATAYETVDDPETVAADVVQTEDQIYNATYVERNLQYEDCGHTVTDILHGDERFVGKTFSQLEGEGWTVSKTGSNKVSIFREVRGLCDADSQKRTLRLTENGIGVYEGPKDTNGELLDEMVLDIEQLPEEVRSQLSGEGMEFANEEEFLETLDSLDEYVSYEYEGYYSGVV